MNRCINALEFIVKYSGVDYKAPSRVNNPAEKQKYEQLFVLAKKNISEYGVLVDEIGEQTVMASFNHKNILDGSNRKIRKYLWGELRSIDHVELGESISIFAEKDGPDESARFRISLEVDELHSGSKALQNHNKLLDLPSAKGCIYALNNTAANNITFSQNREEAKEMIKSGKFKKAQICVLIQNGSEEAMFNGIVEAVTILRPYYDYVLQQYNKRD